MNHLNRRRFERFSVLPMYTSVTVRAQSGHTEHRGHAYDISEGGIRFELDEPIAPGTPVSIEVALPGNDRAGAVLVTANIVWINQDPDEPGPIKMAAAFSRFARPVDRERLLNQLASGRYARAA
jgi:hypothetical protein